jgi:muconolactone delta-isomerase
MAQQSRFLHNGVKDRSEYPIIPDQPHSPSLSGPSLQERHSAGSPSEQLLSTLATASSDALAQLQAQPGCSLSSPAIDKPRQPTARRGRRERVQTVHAQVKVAATLSAQQQELIVAQQQKIAQSKQDDSYRKELRRIAEEKARAVQFENQNRQALNQQVQAIGPSPQTPQPVPQRAAPTHPQPSSVPAFFKPRTQQLWNQMSAGLPYSPHGNVATGIAGPALMHNSISLPNGMGGGVVSQMNNKFRNSSQIGFEIPKR